MNTNILVGQYSPFVKERGQKFATSLFLDTCRRVRLQRTSPGRWTVVTVPCGGMLLPGDIQALNLSRPVVNLDLLQAIHSAREVEERLAGAEPERKPRKTKRGRK